MNQKGNIMRNKKELTSVALEICSDRNASAEQLLQNYQMQFGYLQMNEVMFLMNEVQNIKRIWAMEEEEFKAHLNYV